MAEPRLLVAAATPVAYDATVLLNLVLNGEARSFDVRPDASLLEVIRDHAGLSSPKDGCSPQGQCGCCLVLVDGNPKVACAQKATRAADKQVVTLEGVDPTERDIYARAFARAAGLQCGFCIPGIVMRTKAILDATANPSREEIAKKLDVHLCRCTGYTKIIDAIQLAGRVRTGEPFPPAETSGRVGTSLDRYEGEALTLGMRPYVADLRAEDMLHGAVLLSEHPRATVRAIDLTRARALEGVHTIATWQDVPGERFTGLVESDWPAFVAVSETTHCVGSVIAAVAAETRAVALAALDLIDVDYEVLEPITDPRAALEQSAPRVHPDRSNLLCHFRGVRGDADEALANATHVVRGTWNTQRIEHLYLEPEAAFARPGGDATDALLTLYTQGQGIFDDRRQCAALLGIDVEQLEAVLVPNGGAFGGKEDMSVQAHTCLLAWLSKRPVLTVLSREQSIRMHPKRHPIEMHYEVGCDADGRLTAVRARMLGDTGAYASVGAKVLERAAGHACGPYDVPNVDIEARAVYTNNPPCGAMRGFGANQAHFAMEGALDQLAEEVGLDGWEIRWRNAVDVGSVFASGHVFEKSVGLKDTLRAVKDVYYAHRDRAGIACAIKNSGVGNGATEWGRARLVVEPDASVSIYNGYTEMGQGLLTILIQCACEATGLPARVFRKARVDSRFELACGQTTGSRATLLGGKAVELAGLALRRDLDTGLQLRDLVGRVYVGEHVVDDTHPFGSTPPKGPVKSHTAFGFATQVVLLDEEGRLERVIAAHDVGRVLNPKLCEGQIEGSVHMGLGYALTEEMVCEGGVPTTHRIRDFGVLRARDMPEVETILVEAPEPEGPYGAKGVGEIGLVPTAAAVAGALYAFDGVRRTTLPMKDSAAARAILRIKKSR